MKKRKYLITADDYGMCPEVDSAIEQLAEKGILSTTNVLMNFGTDFTDSPIKKFKRFSIGIHWNVTTGKPVSSLDKIKTLVDSEGNFHSINEFRRRFKKGLIDKSELKLELLNQYDLFYEKFGVPDYWNSHENSSLYPGEYRVFESVALEKGIKATRNFQRVYIDYDNCKGFIRQAREFAVSSFVNVWFGIFAKRKFVMPEGRIVTFENISKTDIGRMKKGLSKTKKRSVEVVIHPATGINEELFGNIADDRIIEFEKYMSDEFYNLFENDNACIVSFDSL